MMMMHMLQIMKGRDQYAHGALDELAWVVLQMGWIQRIMKILRKVKLF